MKLRLHQFLSKTGAFTRKSDIFAAIKNSEIKVSNKTITDQNYSFDPKKKHVYWKGKRLAHTREKIYILINKPKGYLSSKLTTKDKQLKKKSVFSLIENDSRLSKDVLNTLFCAGRLDEKTSGLLLITNDGDIGLRITAPDSTSKTYRVRLVRPLSKEEIAKIRRGVIIELEENGKITKYQTKECRIIPDQASKLIRQLDIILSEGKKREVRRIFEAIGNRVKLLYRIAIGNITLKELNLDRGKYVFVDKKYIESRIK